MFNAEELRFIDHAVTAARDTARLELFDNLSERKLQTANRILGKIRTSESSRETILQDIKSELQDIHASLAP